MRPRLFPVLTLVALAWASAARERTSAQQFVLSSQDRAKLIAVDFVAMGPDGHPVTDLRADEVTLKIDGRTRSVRSLEYVPVGEMAQPVSVAGPIPPPYGSNATAGVDRTAILIVDDETIRQGSDALVKQSVGAFLTGLAPRDRVAVVTVPYGGFKIDLTTDRLRISQAVARIGGLASRTESPAEARCRTRTTLAAIAGTLDSLYGGEGPIAVLFISGHMAVPQGGMIRMDKDAQVGLGECELMPADFERVGDAAARARAQFYVIHPDIERRSDRMAGLEHLAGVTGGSLLHLSDPAQASLARVTRETSGYYLARIEPDPAHAQGSMHGFRIEVSRKDVTVRGRPKMAVVRGDGRPPNAPRPTPLDMMRESRALRDLPLRVTGFVLREPGTTAIQVVSLFESADPSATLSSAMVGLFDVTGKLVAGANLSSAELLTTPATTVLSVAPGTYRMRAAATEAIGRAGAADYTIAAELTDAGPLKLSGLMLGLSRSGIFVPRLEFSVEPLAIAWLEIYGGQPGTPVSVAFELASTVNGPALVTMPGIIEATNEPDRFTVTGALPLGALPAGDYMVRAIVAAEGQPAGRVLRAIRKK